VLWKAVTVWVISCGWALAETDELVLQRYRTSGGYGAVVVTAAPNSVRPDTVRLVEKYAISRGIQLAAEDAHNSAGVRIELSLDSDGSNLIAARYEGERLVDQVRGVTGGASGAQLIVDELLLLWHPPNSNSTRRGGIMDYALRPTSYEVRRRRFFRNESGLLNQRWHPLSSRTPTFTWESFPRKIDLTGDAKAQDFTRVSYQFQITPPIDAASDSAWVKTLAKFSSTFSGLMEPSIALQKPLDVCRRYRWTVRAVFELDGVPRQTEWAGFYAKSSRPWYVRRDLKRFGAMKIEPLAYHFAVRTPKSPFAEACVE
jgi:hypothetical protein